jgi:hypothetical protein
LTTVSNESSIVPSGATLTMPISITLWWYWGESPVVSKSMTA